jgi:hypothetical protein
LNPDDAEWHPTLTPTGNRDVFVVDPGVRESGESCVFHRLGDGRVASVFIAAGTWLRLEPVAAVERAKQKR